MHVASRATVAQERQEKDHQIAHLPLLIKLARAVLFACSYERPAIETSRRA